MPRRASITFIPTPSPITKPVTKFGGQPVWLTEAEWPISRSTGQPMAFICQIALTPELFEGVAPGIAYLFMTPDSKDGFADDTWEPNGGENAVIIQPGAARPLTQPLTVGPTLYSIQPELGGSLDIRVPVEFMVSLNLSEDPAIGNEQAGQGIQKRSGREYAEELSGNKLGGMPYFIQDTQLPISGGWHLLLQLDSNQLPFYINFGDGGIGYAFIARNGRIGKFLWQCY